MADTLEQQILEIVACESTPVWAFFCQNLRTFTVFSRKFEELFAAVPTADFASEAKPSHTSYSDIVEQQASLLPTRSELAELILTRQFARVSERCAPNFQLRMYSITNDDGGSRGVFVSAESRLQVQLSPDRALIAHQASRQIETLSPRESEVLWKVVSGMTNQAIAIDLGLSPKTIEKHRKKMMTKLRVQSVAEAARIAFDAELFQLLLMAQEKQDQISQL